MNMYNNVPTFIRTRLLRNKVVLQIYCLILHIIFHNLYHLKEMTTLYTTGKYAGSVESVHFEDKFIQHYFGWALRKIRFVLQNRNIQ